VKSHPYLLKFIIKNEDKHYLLTTIPFVDELSIEGSGGGGGGMGAPQHSQSVEA
jgi:hypothetical protein